MSDVRTLYEYYKWVANRFQELNDQIKEYDEDLKIQNTTIVKLGEQNAKLVDALDRIASATLEPAYCNGFGNSYDIAMRMRNVAREALKEVQG